MKVLKYSLFLIAILFTTVGIQSCKNECNDVVCLNGGICDNGICECPNGYTGMNCENFDASQVQILLGNHTPIELVNGGIPLDSLYGKMYAGGLIFYLNTDDGTGMVAATEDQGVDVEWGCYGNDIMNLNNATNPMNQETEGARIGDGMANTNAILAGCPADGIAAKLCRDKGINWFLPSSHEFYLMHTNLHAKGYGGFNNGDKYWTSTEVDDLYVWGFRINYGWDWFDKNAIGVVVGVRAARAF